MKLLTGGLAFALALCLVDSAKASFVIEDFNAATTNDVGFSTTVPGVGFASGFIASEQTVIASADGGGGTLTFGITAAPPNPTGYGLFSTLQLDFDTVVGDWQVEVTFDSPSAGVGTTNSPTFIANGTSVAFVDLIDSTETGNLNGLTDLALTFTALSPNAGNRVITLGAITAVPEPTSAALLGLTCLGGGAIATRRRRRQATTA